METSRKSVQVGLGLSSILMIFVILCMMILSVLAYHHALQNYDIAKRVASYEESYSKANKKAEILYELFKKNEGNDTSFTEMIKHQDIQKYVQDTSIVYEIEGSNLYLNIQVNKQQSLHIVLNKIENEVVKESWKLISTGGQSK